MHRYRAPLLLCILLLVQGSASAQIKRVKRVLVINELGPASPGIALVDGKIRAGLEKSPYQIELYTEDLETTLFPDAATQQGFEQWHIYKYRDRKPDVIIAVGPSPLKFLAQSHEKFFAGTPVVFCLTTREMVNFPKLDPSFTGVWELLEPSKSVDIALKLLPSTKHVLVVGGVASYDKQIETKIKEGLREYESRLDVTYLTDLAMPALLERLKQVPRDSIILNAGISKDAAGTDYINATQSTPMLTQIANVPIFSVGDVEVSLGDGTVGGYLTSFAEEGEIVAADALRILSGEKPRDIPVVTGANVYMFDWRVLERWGIKEASLPAGSLVLRRRPGFWELYRRYAIAALFLLTVQTLIIVCLIWQRALRKRTESSLRRLTDQLIRSRDDERKRFDRERHLLEMLELVTKQMAAAVTRCDRDFRYVWANEGAAELLRRPLGEIIGRPIADVMGPAAFQTLQPHFERVLAGEKIIYEQEVDYQGIGRIWISATYSPTLDNQGAVDGWVAVILDITHRKRAEEALRRSESYLAQAEKLAHSGSWAWDVREGAVFWSQEVFRILAYDPQSITPSLSHFLARIHPDDVLRVEQRLEQLASGQDVVFDYRIALADGTIKYLHAIAHPAKNDWGEVLEVVGTIMDVTERNRATDALLAAQAIVRESEERFRLVANTAPVMIWMSGPDRRCSYLNQPWLEFTGRSIETELGSNWAAGIHPDDREQSLNGYTKAFERRESFRMEYRLRRHDGDYRWVLDSGVPRFNADGSFAGYIGSAVDITERKLAEEALSTVSQKLIDAHEEERTWLARELHDDINQRLALLAVTLEGLKESLPASAVESLRHIDEAGKEATDIAKEIQALSHRLHSSKLELLGLAGASAGFCRELSSRQNVEIEFHAEGVPRELPDEIALSLFRVLQEALQNAIKHSGSRHFRVSLDGAANSVELTVHDSGVGFDSAVAINGHGLGLTSMKERVRLVGGQLSVESEPQQGTTVRARVGFVGPTKVHTNGIASHRKQRDRTRGLIKVLVVEDYEPFCRFVCSVLRRREAEFDVTQASDGLEAVEKAVTLEPDLILLDIGLPKLDGFEAAKQILSLIPDTRILFVSEESSSEIIREAFRVGGQGYVRKSNAQSDLMAAIDAILRGERFTSGGLEFGGAANIRSETCPKLVLAENHAAMREMIAKILRCDFDVLASVETGPAALEAANMLKPDVLVIDVMLQGLEGPDVVKQLKDHGSASKIVFVSASMDVTQVSSCLAAGGHAYVSKMKMATDLPIAIRKVLGGEGFVSAM